MDIVFELPNIIKNSMAKANELLNKNTKQEFKEELINSDTNVDNLLYHSDNISAILDLLHRGYGNKLDLIYIDPPFFTMLNYNNKIDVNYQGKKVTIDSLAYTDTWKGGFKEYLEMITIRLILMRELLSESGSIYVHIDFRTVHYIKIIMDCIFGRDRFLNEVIWSYKSGGTSKKHFSRKHDNILVYTMSNKYIFNPQKEKSYNRGYKPYRFKGVMEYQDALGWYTLVNLKDVWQIDMVGRTSKERLGYGTQKPEALLERIILSSSNEGSIVADFFAGSGTTLMVANKNNRKWIGVDIGNSSIGTNIKRFGQYKTPYKLITNKKVKSDNNNLDCNIEVEVYKDVSKKRIKFKSYDLNVDRLNLSKDHKKIIEEILNYDSLALIDYIGIGYLIEKPSIFYEEFRTRDKLKVDFDITIESRKNIYIKIMDIFGNITEKFL